MRLLLIAFGGLIAIVLLYVRFAPVDVDRWHVMPSTISLDDDLSPDSFRAMRAITDAPVDLLMAVETIAAKTPRTQAIAGSTDSGMVTFETRTKVFGFPDYTTVAVTDVDGLNMLVIYGRLRFGVADLGVNAARVQDWLAQLGPLVVARP